MMTSTLTETTRPMQSIQSSFRPDPATMCSPSLRMPRRREVAIAPRQFKSILRRRSGSTIIIPQHKQKQKGGVVNDNYNKKKIKENSSQISSNSLRKRPTKRTVRSDSIARQVQFSRHAEMYFYSLPPRQDEDKGNGSRKKESNLFWYTDREITQWKVEALNFMRSTSNIFDIFSIFGERKASFYSHPSLKVAEGDTFVHEGNRDLNNLLKSQIRRVLVVDTNQDLLDCIVRGVRQIMPHDVSISTASSSTDAKFQVQKYLDKDYSSNTKEGDDADPVEWSPVGFDVIIVGEKLERNMEGTTNVSGTTVLSWINKVSTLISWINKVSSESGGFGLAEKNNYYQEVKGTTFSMSNREPLLIGTSSFLSGDSERLTKSGVDYLWGSPPPTMDASLRNELLMTLLNKRGISSVVIG
jgi:hypothetical protein